MKDLIQEYGNCIVAFFAGISILGFVGVAFVKSQGILSRLFDGLISIYL